MLESFRAVYLNQQKLSVVSYSFEFKIECAWQIHGCTDRQLFNLVIVTSFESCRARQNKYEHQLTSMFAFGNYC